ncbi:hypothetical protein BDR26DRAFT_486204 [Obelidium mucronatum]|nr:hypothetical protein BDR26DRAFT_486204 [Obelidium mucronatum]
MDDAAADNTAYAARTDSLHHFVSDSDGDSDSDATTIHDILMETVGATRLTLVPPVSLDPRMNLEDGMYVEGAVVEGLVSPEGHLVFNTSSAPFRNADNTSSLRVTRSRPPWQPPPPFPMIPNPPEMQNSSYSLEIPNLMSDSSDSDDDDTWIPFDRTSPITFQESNTLRNPGPAAASSTTRSSEVVDGGAATSMLQQRYPRTFNMTTTSFQQTSIPSDTHRIDPDNSSNLVTVESDTISRARRIQEIWSDTSNVHEPSQAPPTSEERQNPSNLLDQVSDNLVSTIVDNVLRDLGFTIESFDGNTSNVHHNQESFSLFRPRDDERNNRSRGFPLSLRTTGRFARIPDGSLRISNPSNLSLSELNSNFEYDANIRAPAILTGIPSRLDFLGDNSQTSYSRSDPWIHAVRALARELQTYGDGASNAFSQIGVTAVAIAAMASAAVRDSGQLYEDEDYNDQSDRRVWLRRRRNNSPSADMFADSNFDWSSRIQVLVTRRLYRAITPTSTSISWPSDETNDNHPNINNHTTMRSIEITEASTTSPQTDNRLDFSSSSSTSSSVTTPLSEASLVLWEPNNDEESITVQMPLCEWLLTRSLLDANGDVIGSSSASNERGLSASTELANVDAGTGIQYLEIGTVQSLESRRQMPEICGFDVPGGGTDLLFFGMDGNGDRVVGGWPGLDILEHDSISGIRSLHEARDDAVAAGVVVEVEEAVYEQGDSEQDMDDFRVGVVRLDITRRNYFALSR